MKVPGKRKQNEWIAYSFFLFFFYPFILGRDITIYFCRAGSLWSRFGLDAFSSPPWATSMYPLHHAVFGYGQFEWSKCLSYKIGDLKNVHGPSEPLTNKLKSKKESSMFKYEDTHGLINYTDTKAKCRHLKILIFKGTLLQIFICARPSLLTVFCLRWSSNFVGSEYGQIRSVKLLQNMVSNTTQHPHPLPATHCL